MSYCRWSSNDFDCDVYVYEDCGGGWTTHVAGGRYLIDRSTLPPLPDDRDSDDFVPAWVARHAALSKLLEGATTEPIGLAHDGQSFNDPTPGACADRLEALRGLGYRVPLDAIAMLREEQHEDDVAGGSW